MHVAPEGFGWGMWQHSEHLQQPIGFWFQLWKGAESQCSPVEKQLAAEYAASLATEGVTGTMLVMPAPPTP